MSSPKYLANPSDFITLLCCCGWLRGKLHFSQPWIISLLHSHHLALSNAPFFRSTHAYVSSVFFPVKVFSFLLVCTFESKGLLYEKLVMFYAALSSHLLLLLLFSVSQLLPYTLNNCSTTCPGCLAHVFFHLSPWLIWKLPPLAPLFHWKSKAIGGYLTGLDESWRNLEKKKKKAFRLFIHQHGNQRDFRGIMTQPLWARPALLLWELSPPSV